MASLPKWRPFTWVIVVINVLFVVWIIGGVLSVSDSCAGKVGQELKLCEGGTAVGAGIAVTAIIVFWVLVDVILGVLWLVTNRKKTRECPVCGSDVKKGVTVCGHCGYDFVTGARPSPSA